MSRRNRPNNDNLFNQLFDYNGDGRVSSSEIYALKAIMKDAQTKQQKTAHPSQKPKAGSSSYTVTMECTRRVMDPSSPSDQRKQDERDSITLKLDEELPENWDGLGSGPDDDLEDFE